LKTEPHVFGLVNMHHVCVTPVLAFY